MQVDFPIISSDSHVSEPPNTYIDYIDPAYRDVAPHVVETEDRGDVYVIDGMKRTIPMGLIAAAGQKAEELNPKARYADLHPSGWDPKARIGDQDLDGVSAEVIYPSVGMVLCNHQDFDYKKATMDAYNRWIGEYCSENPDRLIGTGQTAMRSPEEGIADLESMKALGLRGVMMPGNPQVEDYDSPIYDEFYAAAVEMQMPLSFHILTSRSDSLNQHRGPKINSFLSIMRGNQDIMGMFVFGGVFERNPKLRVSCVEADAGWVPHFMYRMDHAYDRHRAWLKASDDMKKMPSDYFREHIYMTFQDDFIAFQTADLMNWRRLMWANDFPHSDSTWPWSQELLTRHASDLTPEQQRAILCDNVADLYNIDLTKLPIGGDQLAAGLAAG